MNRRDKEFYMNTVLQKYGLLVLLLAALFAAGLFAMPAVARSLAYNPETPTFNWLVNNTGDGSGSCTPESCSLRQAIIAANASTGSDLISFSIPITDTNFNPTDGYWLITLSSALPALSDPYTILDANSQPAPGNAPEAPQSVTDLSDCSPVRIQINAAAANYGFEVTATAIDIHGFKVYGAQTNGIYIHGTNAKSGHMFCNRITDSGDDGIYISNGASENIIGPNLISGNGGDGVEINQASQNSIDGNFIGVDYYGLTAYPNAGNGVLIINGAISNTVMAPWDGISVISGNLLAGVRIESSGSISKGNKVNNLLIGAASDQDSLIPNKDGVIISNAEKNEVTNNLIVGNNRDGVAVTGGQAKDNFIGSNDIGTDVHAGSLGNARDGVLLDAESYRTILSDNKIGHNGYFGDYTVHGGVIIKASSGQNTLFRNEISYNDGDGVLVTGASTAKNKIDQNSIYNNTLEGINLEGGANDNLAEPYITSYIIRISGISLEATAYGCPGCVFQIFSDDGGEGGYYEGWGNVSSTGKIGWKGTPHGSGTAYTLTVTDAQGNTSEFSAAPVYLDLSIDDAKPHITVNKLIGDSDGVAGKTIVEVAAKINGYDPSLTDDLTLTLTIPGNVLGAPVRVFYRDSISSLDGTAITSYTNPSSGVYELGGISLNEKTTIPASGPYIYSYERLIVFRFEMPYSMSANSQLILTSSLSAGVRALARSYDWARINAAKKVDGILITNRSLLYYNNYHGAEGGDEDIATTQLLQTVFKMAQGAPYVSNSPVLAVYYVDQYSTTARNWDNTAVDYSDQTTANTVANLVDSMTNDWFEDSTTKYSYYLCFGGMADAIPNNLDFTVVILGDDDVIPYYRSPDPVYDPLYTTESDESDTDDLSDSLLRNMAANNYFFTDNPYADLYSGSCTYTRSWQEGGVEAYIGRIVGATSADMEKLIKSGLAGPQLSQTNGAIVASYGGFDADNIEAYMNSYPLNVFSSALVDDDGWRLADLLSYMDGSASGSTSWLAFAHGGHANNKGWCTPFGDDKCHGLDASALNTGPILTNISSMHPVVSSGGCRSGMSLAASLSSTIYGWVRAGASSIMASTGISYGSTTEGIYLYGEDLHQHYWYDLLLINPYKVSTGFALQLNKSKWNKGISWDGFEEKTVREFTLFGLPWVGFYQPATAPVSGVANLRTVLPPEELAWPISAPAAVSASTYVVTATVDASEYTISQVSGFDLVNVQGMRLHYGDRVPVIPIAELSMPLPLGAAVQEVQVTPLDALSLGALQIPMVSPGIPYPGGPKDAFRETPPEMGIYPSQLYSAAVTTVAGSQLAQLTIFPLVYNADTHQTTLYQHLVVRITYWVPTPVGLLGLSADPANAAVGDSLHIHATLLNASDQVIEVGGVLTLTDSLGQAVAIWPIPAFAVPAGSPEFPLDLDWAPGAPEGAYTLELEVWRGSDPHMHAEQAVAFVAGRLSELNVTPLVRPFEPGLFEVTFENLSSLVFNGQIHYEISIAGGLRVAELDVPFSVAPHEPITLVTPWDVSALLPGNYTVTAMVTDLGGMTTYGPLQQEFVVAYSLFMPMVSK
jgi:hypothetical protein